MSDVSIIEYKKIDLSNCLLVVAFPTVGLISSIAGHHIVQSLRLKEIGAIISSQFMPTAVVHDGYPSPPVRIYAGKKICGPQDSCDQIAVIMSEFMPPYEIITSLVNEILSWSKKKGCRIITALEGTHAEGDISEKNVRVFGVASTKLMKEMLKKYDIKETKEGMITGVTGVLLYNAALLKQDAICLLAQANADYPDSRAAANIVTKLDIMLPGIKIDAKPLYEQADEIEQKIRKFLEQSKPTAPPLPSNMYR
ncbi:MAG: PAC2 family protein [Candidatus Thermoplasmatota archaeon]|nr:PAC2 family protein [Candidatus Thermoplasmatota archaeon]